MWHWLTQHIFIRVSFGDVAFAAIIIILLVVVVVMLAVGYIQDVLWRHRERKGENKRRKKENLYS